MMPTAAFAADVPVLLSASEAGVDVIVSENITLTSQEGSAELIVSDLTVKNNATIGSIEITHISATAENGWSLAPEDSGFESMQANAKKLYLGYGSHDFSAGAFSASNLEIAPGQTETISLSAKTGIVTADISAQKVATVIITVGLKESSGDTVSEETKAGLYDDNGVMIASWDTLETTYGMDVATGYAPFNNRTATTSVYYVLTSNSELSTGTKLIISDKVTTIGSYAFADGTNLTSVIIGDGVASISDYAFSTCTGLTSVTIGSRVTSIGGYAFKGCTGLTSITIPDSVTSMGSGVFYSCRGLTTVTIGKGVTSIGGSVFTDCAGLASITIPDSVISIGATAFSDCTGLMSVTIPSSVSSIGSKAFEECEKLTSVYFEHTTAPTFGSKCFTKTSGDMCTFYFKNSAVGNSFTTDYYNESYGTKSTNYNW